MAPSETWRASCRFSALLLRALFMRGVGLKVRSLLPEVGGSPLSASGHADESGCAFSAASWAVGRGPKEEGSWRGLPNAAAGTLWRAPLVGCWVSSPDVGAVA